MSAIIKHISTNATIEFIAKILHLGAYGYKHKCSRNKKKKSFHLYMGKTWFHYLNRGAKIYIFSYLI
jgi:hypothetical protein